MTMTPEQEVRAVWGKAYKFQSLSGKECVQFGSHSLETWEEALEFTRKRQQEIAEIEAEIEWIVTLPKQMKEWSGPWQRILSRLEKQLGELKRGLK